MVLPWFQKPSFLQQYPVGGEGELMTAQYNINPHIIRLLSQSRWIITWIQRRLEAGNSGKDEALPKVEQLIAQIYHFWDGYDCSETEQVQLDNSVENKSWFGRLMGGHEASVYGEVLPEGIQTLLDVLDDEMPITESDVFVDLGSGTGKIVLQAALSTPCKKVVGIELSATRHKHGIDAMKNAGRIAKECKSTELDNDESLCKEYAQKTVDALTSGRLQIIHGDIMKPTYNDATHLYAASTTWPDTLLHTVAEIAVKQITNVKTFSTLRPLPAETLEEFKSISLWKAVDVAVSWQDNAPINIYRFDKQDRAAKKKQ